MRVHGWRRVARESVWRAAMAMVYGGGGGRRRPLLDKNSTSDGYNHRKSK